jgi:sialic acid synthase SpsE
MRVELIAECSSNHGGSIPLAKEFIKRFAAAGADWVKFQSFKVKHLRPDDPQADWFRRSELSDDAHHELKAACEAEGTKFLTTVYHVDEVPFLAALGLAAIKIGSGEGQERALSLAAIRHFPRVLISAGLGSPAIHDHPRHGYDHLACITRYPAPHGMVPASLGRNQYFQGWSDHCVGLESCQVAIIRGARIIEKHVQLMGQARDPKPFEATTDEFKALRAFADEDPQRFLGRWQFA